MRALAVGAAALMLSAVSASAQALRTLWLRLQGSGSALRLCRSSVGDTEWVRAIDLHTETLRTNSCLPSAAVGARLLCSAVSGGFAAVI